MSERPGLKAQVAQLQAENRALRAQLNGEPEPTIEDVPGAVMSGEVIIIPELQARRDNIAVSALIASHLDVYAALEWIGYPVATMTKEQRYDLAHREFDNDRIRDILDEALKPAETAKDTLIQQQLQSALYGEPKQRAHAFQFLAKVSGWYGKPERADPRSAGISFHRVMHDLPAAQPEATALDALDAFSHEPQESPSIDTADDVLDTPMIPDRPKLPWPERFGGYPRSA